jgi:hypothetical protein
LKFRPKLITYLDMFEESNDGILIDETHVFSSAETHLSVRPVFKREDGVYQLIGDYVLWLEITSYNFPKDAIDIAKITELSAVEFLHYLVSFLRK